MFINRDDLNFCPGQTRDQVLTYQTGGAGNEYASHRGLILELLSIGRPLLTGLRQAVAPYFRVPFGLRRPLAVGPKDKKRRLPPSWW